MMLTLFWPQQSMSSNTSGMCPVYRLTKLHTILSATYSFFRLLNTQLTSEENRRSDCIFQLRPQNVRRLQEDCKIACIQLNAAKDFRNKYEDSHRLWPCRAEHAQVHFWCCNNRNMKYCYKNLLTLNLLLIIKFPEQLITP